MEWSNGAGFFVSKSNLGFVRFIDMLLQNVSSGHDSLIGYYLREMTGWRVKSTCICIFIFTRIVCLYSAVRRTVLASCESVSTVGIGEISNGTIRFIYEG